MHGKSKLKAYYRFRSIKEILSSVQKQVKHIRALKFKMASVRAQSFSHATHFKASKRKKYEK